MAHFAQIDSDGQVLQIIVVSNDTISDPDTGTEVEQKGVDFCRGLLGDDTNWVQTSYNNNFRGQYATVGGRYDSTHDVFLPPQPYPSWTFNFAAHRWEAPTALPDDGLPWQWDENSLSWVLPTPPEPDELSDPQLQELSAQINAALSEPGAN